MKGLLPPRDTRGRDLLVAGVAFASGLVLFGLGTYPLLQGLPYTPSPVWHLPPMAVAAGCLALRRRAPLVGLVGATVAFLIDVAVGASLATVLIFTQMLYEACVFGSRATWRWLLRITAVVTVAGTAAAFAATGQVRVAGSTAVIGVLLLLFPVVTGLSVRQYRDQAEAERLRAQQTARLAILDRRAAVIAERHRMARELHDVVANHLSAVAIHATGAQAAYDRDPGVVREALAVIRDSSVRGLAELRHVIGLLRDSDAEPDALDNSLAQPRLAEVDRLVEAVRGAGVPVRMAVTGQARPLPTEVELAAYRILQESLTNVLKHARGGAARAELCYQPDQVVITVENPLPASAERESVPGAGAGLVGMRERAALLGGTLAAGPEHGRWRVRAGLPIGSTA